MSIFLERQAHVFGGQCVCEGRGVGYLLAAQIFNKIAEIRLKLPPRSHFERVLFI